MPSGARTQQFPDKEALRTDLLNKIREDLATLTSMQKDASEGATHSESRAENAKDTRATEQSYLARGLAERVEELRLAEARLAQLSLRKFEPSDTIEHWRSSNLTKETIKFHFIDGVNFEMRV